MNSKVVKFFRSDPEPFYINFFFLLLEDQAQRPDPNPVVRSHIEAVFVSAFDVLSCKFNSTVCPRSFDPFYVVNYNIKLVKTSWTDSTPNGQAIKSGGGGGL